MNNTNHAFHSSHDQHQILAKWGECSTTSQLFEALEVKGRMDEEKTARASVVLADFLTKWEAHFTGPDIPALRNLTRLLKEIKSVGRRRSIPVSDKINATIEKINEVRERIYRQETKEIRNISKQILPPVLLAIVAEYEPLSTSALTEQAMTQDAIKAFAAKFKKVSLTRRKRRTPLTAAEEEEIKLFAERASPEELHRVFSCLNKEIGDLKPGVGGGADRTYTKFCSCFHLLIENLNELNLSNCDQLFRALRFKPLNFRHISVLNLSGCQLTPGIQNFPQNLTTLILSNDGLRTYDKSHQHTLHHKYLSKLKFLDLSNNPHLPSAQITVIREALPNTTVLVKSLKNT